LILRLNDGSSSSRLGWHFNYFAASSSSSRSHNRFIAVPSGKAERGLIEQEARFPGVEVGWVPDDLFDETWIWFRCSDREIAEKDGGSHVDTAGRTGLGLTLILPSWKARPLALTLSKPNFFISGTVVSIAILAIGLLLCAAERHRTSHPS
jgi:hypothetical protein